MKQTWQKLMWMGAGLTMLSMVSVLPARGQFGVDIAAIISGLNAINSSLGKFIAKPLSSIQQTEANSTSFLQKQIYPTSSISSNQALASALDSAMSSNKSLFSTQYSSSSLAPTSNLESVELSSNPNAVQNLGTAYQQVYGSLPVQGKGAPQDTVTAIDMGDAQAQDALKKSIILDSLSAREMELSQQIMTQLKTASPGSAAMLNAQAAALVLQGNAYSQSGMAALLRVSSANLSYTGYALKHASISNHNLQRVITNLYTR